MSYISYYWIRFMTAGYLNLAKTGSELLVPPVFSVRWVVQHGKSAAFTGIFWDMPKERLGSRRTLCLNWQLAGKWIQCEVNPQKCRFLLLRQQRASVQDICCSVIRIHLVTCPSARPLLLYYVSWEPAPFSLLLSLSPLFLQGHFKISCSHSFTAVIRPLLASSI